MKDLVKAEWFKLRKSLGFKLLLAVNGLCGICLVSTYILLGEGNASLGLCGYRAMGGGVTMVLMHAYIGYLFAAVFLCKEFSNRTFAMSLLCGHSRTKIFASKAAGFLLGYFLLYWEFVGIVSIGASAVYGFGMEWSMDILWEILLLLGVGLMACFTTGAVAVLIATAARKAIVTIGVGIGHTYALLWLETNFREHPLPFMKYAYTYQIRELYWRRETFSSVLFLVVTLLTSMTALAAAALVFKGAELK